jgi:nicotinamidase-related amidase
MSGTLPPVEPARTALLVMDYQPAILGRLDRADELLTRAARMIGAARQCRITVGYVRVAFTDADYAAIPSTNKMFSGLASSRMMPADAPESAIHPAVAPQAGDIIVRKTRVGVFSTTDLDRQLRDRGIDTVVLAGISTSGVVLSTVRAAADLDYRLFVVTDCCADPERRVHDFLISDILPKQATMVDAATVAQIAATRGTASE